MSKLLIIGIDGMDPDLVFKWKDDLPNLKKLQMFKMESVFPPDSISAWVTIFTGLNPAQHGILHSIDYLDSRVKDFSVNTSVFKGRTFWDIDSKAGKKVCIINPFLAHPVWNVNGIMVSGPVFISGEVDAFPKSILKRYKIPPLGGIVDFPTKKTLGNFYEKTRKSALNLAEFGIKMLKENNCDLYFITFLTLDRIQHFFWRYCDERDPTYPGNNPYHNVIKEFYILFDGIVGKFISSIDKNTELMLISDHGHGRRCTKSLNLNEFLRRKGYLTSGVKGIKFFQPKYWIERAKTRYLNLVYHYELEDLTMRIARYVPKKTELKKSTYITDFSDSLAWIDKDFSGMNPFGGVRINRDKTKKERLNYNKTRNMIIDAITEIQDHQTKIIKWICPREKIYQGKFINKYPDIIFELNEEYGLGFALYAPIISLNITHRKISGGHRKYGVFFASNVDEGFNDKHLSILDVVPTILDILNIRSNIKFSGKSIFKK